MSYYEADIDEEEIILRDYNNNFPDEEFDVPDWEQDTFKETTEQIIVPVKQSIDTNVIKNLNINVHTLKNVPDIINQYNR
jgi:hypothetical protein